MRMCDWSSDVCSSDLPWRLSAGTPASGRFRVAGPTKRSFNGCEMRRSNVAEARRWNSTLRAAFHLVSGIRRPANSYSQDRQSAVQGKSVSVRIDHGGRRAIKKKQHRTILEIDV